MLTVRNLCKHYSARKGNLVRALDNVSLSLGPGMYGLLGPNGAGKSSLMRTLATLQQPDSGQILFDGQDILARPEQMRSRLGYLPQEFGVYHNVSAYDLLDYLGKLKGLLNRVDRHEQVVSLLEKVNLTEHQNESVSRFSGGMKQRFGIAQALLNNPDILIVDEPTAGLDPEERNRFHNLLVDISSHKVVLLSTHIVEDVRHLCPKMGILSAGKLVKQGTPKQIIKEVQGRIWSTQTGSAESDPFDANYRVISKRLFAGRMTINVFSDSSPGADFVEIEPDLADAYFAILKAESVASGNREAPHA